MLIVTRNKYVKYDLLLEETNKDDKIFSRIYGILGEIAPKVSQFRDSKTTYSVRLESKKFIDALLQAVAKSTKDSRYPRGDTNWDKLRENLEKIKADIRSEGNQIVFTGVALARKMFNEKIELNDAVQRNVFPCVISIKTPQGVGTGFFAYEKWLVSNVHVLPDLECVETATLVRDTFKEVTIDLGEYGSFHRPIKNAPDISIVNTLNSNKFFPFNKLSSDTVYDVDSIFFYVYLDHDSQEKKVEYIEYVKQRGNFLTYKCNPGNVPAHGSSGSSVIEAKLVVGSYPKWRFRNVGVVYARSLTEGEMLVHVISPDFDFEQIRREIIIPHDESKRLRKEAASSSDKKLSKTFDAQQQEHLALKSFIRYSTETVTIDLPDDLEKLIASYILPLNESMFLKKGFKNSVNNLAELMRDFFELIKIIQENGSIRLDEGNGFFKTKCFRIDIGHGVDDSWKVDLQDNTGKDSTGKPIKVGSKSASSIFAIINVPKNIETIEGSDLAEMLIESVGCKLKILTEDRMPEKLKVCHAPAIAAKSGTWELIIRRDNNSVEKIPAPIGFDRKELKTFFDRNKEHEEIFLLWDENIIQWILSEGGHVPSVNVPSVNIVGGKRRFIGKATLYDEFKHKTSNNAQQPLSVEVRSDVVEEKVAFVLSLEMFVAANQNEMFSCFKKLMERKNQEWIERTHKRGPEFNGRALSAKLAEKLPAPHEGLTLIEAYKQGKLSTEEVRKKFSEILGIDISLDEFLSAWNSVYSFTKDTILLIKAINHINESNNPYLKIIIYSSVSQAHFDYICNEFKKNECPIPHIINTRENQMSKEALLQKILKDNGVGEFNKIFYVFYKEGDSFDAGVCPIMLEKHGLTLNFLLESINDRISVEQKFDFKVEDTTRALPFVNQAILPQFSAFRTTLVISVEPTTQVDIRRLLIPPIVYTP